MERLLKLTSLVLVSILFSVTDICAVSFNSLITSQTISLTEVNTSTNVLEENAVIDASKNYSLTLSINLDIDNTMTFVDYTLSLPTQINITSAKSTTQEASDMVNSNIKQENGLISVSFFSDPQYAEYKITIYPITFELGDNYNGESVTLSFPYGNSSTDFNVSFTNYIRNITGFKVSGTKVPFNGKAHTVEIEKSGIAQNCSLSYSNDGETFNMNEAPTFTTVGDHIVYVKASLENYEDAFDSAHVIITKRPVNITANDIQIHQGEESTAELTYTTDNVVEEYPISDIQLSLIPETESNGIVGIAIESSYPYYEIALKEGAYTITPHQFEVSDTIIVTAATCLGKGSQMIVSECKTCHLKDTADAIDIQPLGHKETTKVITETSCFEEGKSITICERCLDTINVIITPKKEHTWGKDSTYTKNPTCEEKGAFTTKCFVCDAVKEDSIAALGHDFDIIKKTDVEPTCSKEGSKSRHCKRIGCDAKTEVEIIEKKAHTWGRDTTVISPATCTEKGVESITCLKCDATKTDSIKALGHQYADTFSIDSLPKCLENGSKSKHCIRCDASIEAISIPAIGHQFDTAYTIDRESNCIEYGIKSRHCIHTGCQVSIDTLEIEALGGHVWETDSVIKEATCLEGGIVNRKCIKCGEISENVNIKALGHTYTDTFIVDVEPTCLIEGTHSKHCIRCADRTEVSSIPATGHTWDAGDTILAPTCTEKGVIKFNCIKGDSTKTDTVDALGHDIDPAFTIDVPATCTTDGKQSQHCRRTGCDKTENESVITSPGHQWKDTVVSIAPTCLTKGESIITCEVCKTTKKEPIDSLGHNFSDEFTIDVEPTCEANGKKSKHCLNEGCHATDEETIITPIGHSMVLDTIQIKATCEENGQSIYKCEVCGKKETRVEAALGHVFADTFTVDRIATCKTEGVKSKHCIHEGCLEKIEIFAIPQGDHILKENQVIQKATCTENGLIKFKCEVCGTMVDSTIQKLGHDWENQYTIDLAPTCTRGGSKSKHCTRCDAKTGTTVIPSPGHMESQVRWENVIEPTCTENGEHDENFYCDRCGDLLRTSHKIDLAKGHDYEGTEEYFVKPTCTEPGVVLYTCKVCGNIAKDSVKAMGHLFAEEYTVDKPATCLELGSESRHCTRTDCDAKYDKRDIAPIGHLWNEGDTIQNPSCTEKGIISKFCERCQAKEEKILDPLGHAFADTFTVDVPPTCMMGGSKSRHCTRCEEKKDITPLNPVDHQPSDPIKEDHRPASCLEPGTYTEVIVCRFCGLELSRTQGVSEPPTGHIWNDGEDVVAPTCLEGGIKTFTCTACGAVDTRNVEALGHTYADTFTVDKPVTCLTDGLQSRHCIRCDIHGFETTITHTGHLASAEVKENEVVPTCTTAGQYDNVTYCAVCKTELVRSHVDLEPLGHQWNMNINTQEPTCTGKGVISHTCKICNITETMEISELGHDFKDTITVAATCIDPGYIAKRCTRCNTTSIIQELPVKGHQEAEPVQENVVPATCKSMGSYDEVIYCSVCNKEIHRSRKESGFTDHTWDTGNITQEPTCTNIGTLNYTCTVCGEKRTEEIPALGHQYEEALTIDIPVSCVQAGILSRHCTRCESRIDFDTIPATGHEFNNGVITKEATGDEEGIKTFTCMHCDSAYTIALMKLITLNEVAQGQFFSVNAEGYCQGDEGFIAYTIRDGVPLDFKLTFSDVAKAQGFEDIDWTSAPSDQKIQMNIPENCVAGKYEADVIFRNEDTVETQPMKVFITVNLGQETMVAIFRDVVSIVNDGSKVFESYQWYHNNEIVEGATLPYYQEPGGLSGTYYVCVNLGSSQEARTCARNNWYNPLNKNKDFTVFPNPIREGNDINIKLYNFKEEEHSLTLINEFGTLIYGPFIFQGDELTIPADNVNMVSGQYVISIDGVNVKVLKQ